MTVTKQQVSFWLNDEHADRLKALAAATERTLTWHLQKAVAAYLGSAPTNGEPQ